MSNKAIDVLVIDLPNELIDEIVKLRDMVVANVGREHPELYMGIQLSRSNGETKLQIAPKKR